MVSFFPGYDSDKNRKVYVAILAFALCIGVIAGGFWAVEAKDSLRDFLRHAPVADVSLVSLSVSFGLLILLSCFSLAMSQRWVIILLALFKGLCLGILGVGTALSFATAGGLISFLFLFSEIITVPMLIWFWIHPFSSVRKICCAGISALIFSLVVHYFNDQYISNFLADLFRI